MVQVGVFRSYANGAGLAAASGRRSRGVPPWLVALLAATDVGLAVVVGTTRRTPGRGSRGSSPGGAAAAASSPPVMSDTATGRAVPCR
ncbi:hypothetical protein [Microtetraspora niveoalba]|uniref:hypothetical protein n=1 Tax=Microtetraspora niveoalba TaxID=46175 RepID=UPI000834F741|nr:hypothetical protein [Microtetraspora niveoalba]